MNSIMNLLYSVNFMRSYLDGRIEFDSAGWPIFKKEYFLNEWPQLVVPYSHRKNRIVTDCSKTVICFYMSDNYLFPRLNKVLDDISEYRKYLGVISLDITVTRDMDIEMQYLILLANQLFMAILAVNGIKIIFNTRIASNETIKSFDNIPRGVMCGSGFLGCTKASSIFYASLYVNKVMKLVPEKLIIYGKKDPIIFGLMDNLGINYRRYDDFHTLSNRGVA